MCQMVKMKAYKGEEIIIAELKKKFIDNIIFHAPKCNIIQAIILFGSALEDRCTENSDIDIAIITKLSVSAISRNKSYRDFMRNVYMKDIKQGYDIIYFKSFAELDTESDNAEICREISQKGKIIYELQGGAG